MTLTYQGKKFFLNGERVSPFDAWQHRGPSDSPATGKLAELDRMLARSRSLGGCVPESALSYPLRAGAPTLLPFQQVPQYYARFTGDFLIGDDPGTGKTLEALSVVNLDQAKRVLVVCPAHKREDWAAEIERSTRLPEPQLVYGDVDVAGRPKSVICSWNLLSDSGVCAWLLALRFDDIILDEIHHAKNLTASRTRNALMVAAKRENRILGLSGTFPPNYSAEIFPALKTFRRTNSWKRKDFLRRYSVVRHEKFGRQPGRDRVVGSKNNEELQFNLRTKFMVRRSIGECFPQMPPPILRLQLLRVAQSTRFLIEEERAYRREYLSPGNDINKMPIGAYAELRQKIAVSKIPFIAKYAKSILETEHKLVILAHHRAVVNELARILSAYNPVKILGGIEPKRKHKLKEQFQTDDECRLCIGNIAACGEAIDLFAAAYGIMAEASWVPGDNEQAIGRLQRYGQVKQVRWDFLVVQDSLDAKVLKRAMEKSASLEQVKDARLQGELQWLEV